MEKTDYVNLNLPVRTVDVLIRQGGYQDLINKHFLMNRLFPWRSLNPDRVHANKQFVNALLNRRTDKVNQLVDNILQTTPKDVRSVLDIGCGLGLVDLVLYKRITPSPVIYLLDKNSEYEQLRPVRGGFHQRFVFTADLNLSREIFSRNGADSEQVRFVKPNNDAIASLPKVDLILSITSWGFHYPIETYWKGVQKIITNESVLFIDLRKETNGFHFLRNRFSHDYILNETETLIRVAFSNSRFSN